MEHSSAQNEQTLDPGVATKDPFPFHKDGIPVKVSMLFALLAPLIGTVVAIVLLWGHGVNLLALGLLLGFWA
ncbi:MAG: hypothetical protein KY455_07080, partial [Euryarchaeota archaeon]|nr:hypothetical protein [Euryarchaeota archaeon]